MPNDPNKYGWPSPVTWPAGYPSPGVDINATWSKLLGGVQSPRPGPGGSTNAGPGTVDWGQLLRKFGDAGRQPGGVLSWLLPWPGAQPSPGPNAGSGNFDWMQFLRMLSQHATGAGSQPMGAGSQPMGSLGMWDMLNRGGSQSGGSPWPMNSTYANPGGTSLSPYGFGRS